MATLLSAGCLGDSASAAAADLDEASRDEGGDRTVGAPPFLATVDADGPDVATVSFTEVPAVEQQVRDAGGVGNLGEVRRWSVAMATASCRNIRSLRRRYHSSAKKPASPSDAYTRHITHTE